MAFPEGIPTGASCIRWSDAMKKIVFVFIALVVLLVGGAAYLFFGNAELKGRFAAFDVDGDGALSRQEVGPIIRRTFAEHDRNGDGTLDGREVRRLMVGSIRQRSRKPVEAPAPVLHGERADLDDVTAYLEKTVEVAELEGVVLLVANGGTVLYERNVGDLTSDTVIPIASGSKWITAALLLSLVDDGLLSLDEPLAAHLPYLEGTPSAGVTLRHALSHTSGFGSEHLLMQPFEMELAASARAVADTERIAEPGAAFHYTGAAMQLAAAAAEAATGRTWAELFEERIAGPLGMTSTAYGHPMREIGFADNRNLIAESGVHTSAHDYLRFLEMIAGGGVFRGKQVLSADAVSEMEADYTRGLEISFLPPGAKPTWGYGLGLWCEDAEADGRCATMNSAGAFGAFPWLDRRRDLYGVLFVVDSMPRLVDRILAIRGLVEDVVDDGLES
jgi:CubicO group peptidase (beta-lactamase class C family)